MSTKLVPGVVQLTNKINAQPFNPEDELVFTVFVSYCSLIVHFYNMEQKKIYHVRKQSSLLWFTIVWMKLCPYLMLLGSLKLNLLFLIFRN